MVWDSLSRQCWLSTVPQESLVSIFLSARITRAYYYQAQVFLNLGSEDQTQVLLFVPLTVLCLLYILSEYQINEFG